MSFLRHCVCVPVCLYMHHGYWVTEVTRRGLRCPLELECSSAIGNCKPLDVYAYWEPNLTLLQEHQLLCHLSNSYLVFLRQGLVLTWSPLTRLGCLTSVLRNPAVPVSSAQCATWKPRSGLCFNCVPLVYTFCPCASVNRYIFSLYALSREAKCLNIVCLPLPVWCACLVSTTGHAVFFASLI